MRVPLSPVAALTVVPMLLIACTDLGRPTDPSTAAPSLFASATQPHATATERLVSMMDACDPETFNAAIGPETCVRRTGGVTFSEFIAELTRTQKAGSWHFAPLETMVAVGQTLVAVNRGGEVHTFTRVAEFGGGIVPILNNLSGNPTVAPECLALGPDDFVAPGASAEETIDESGAHRFECCIHPWMRSTVLVP